MIRRWVRLGTWRPVVAPASPPGERGRRRRSCRFESRGCSRTTSTLRRSSPRSATGTPAASSTSINDLGDGDFRLFALALLPRLVPAGVPDPEHDRPEGQEHERDRRACQDEDDSRAEPRSKRRPTIGSTTVRTVRNGSSASAIGTPRIFKSGSRKPRASTPASVRTSERTVRASDWNVRSRPRATSKPSEPPSRPAAAVTPITSRTWPGETPPRSRQRKKTGADVASSVRTWRRLAISLPRMISTSRRSVISRSTNVRRSFSWATEVAAESGAKNSIRVSWKRTNQRKRRCPKYAMRPTSEISANPTRDCQAVHIRMKSRPTYEARAT